MHLSNGKMLLALVSLQSCSGAPKVPVCGSNAEDPVTHVVRQGFKCLSADQKEHFEPYTTASPKVCYDPGDLAALIQYWKDQCRP